MPPPPLALVSTQNPANPAFVAARKPEPTAVIARPADPRVAFKMARLVQPDSKGNDKRGSLKKSNGSASKNLSGASSKNLLG